MKEKKGSLITGLWKHQNASGEDILIGRIGANLNAVVVKNPDYEKDGMRPEFLLYFFNGKQGEFVNADNSTAKKGDKNE